MLLIQEILVLSSVILTLLLGIFWATDIFTD